MMTKTPTRPETGNSASRDGPLTSAQFHILLTLAEGRRHGYGIMLEVEARTGGAVELGPGTLYRSIKQLLKRGFIIEVDDEADDPQTSEPKAGGAPKRPYALTPMGRARTAEEAQRLKELVQWAENAMVLEGGRP
jgi:DNA-binding PadR family transcriptional regulator